MKYYCSNCGLVGHHQLTLIDFEIRCDKCLATRAVRSCRDVVLQFWGTTLQKDAFLRMQNCGSCRSRFECYTQ